MELHHTLLLVHFSLLVFFFRKRSDLNKFHLDYFILHIAVLLLVPILYIATEDFNLNIGNSKYIIGCLIHFISIVAIRYNIVSSISGYRVELKVFHLVVLLTFILLAILVENGYYFYQTPTFQNVFYDIVIEDKLFFINLIIIRQIVCFILIVDLIHSYIKSTKKTIFVKNIKLFNIWVYFYSILVAGGAINMIVLYFDFFDPAYNPIQLSIQSFFAVVNTWYFIFIPSVIFMLPGIKRKVYYYEKNDAKSQLRITLLYEKEKIFLKKDLSLRSVSLLIGLKESIIRTSIKNSTGLNFVDFTNKYRVEYALTLMKFGYLDKNVITSLGESSGFSSNQTFYRAFRKVYNDTPSNYYKSL